jgi:hypothetical protein
VKHEDRDLLELATRNVEDSAARSDGKGKSYGKGYHGKCDGKNHGYGQSKGGGSKGSIYLYCK